MNSVYLLSISYILIVDPLTYWPTHACGVFFQTPLPHGGTLCICYFSLFVCLATCWLVRWSVCLLPNKLLLVSRRCSRIYFLLDISTGSFFSSSSEMLIIFLKTENGKYQHNFFLFFILVYFKLWISNSFRQTVRNMQNGKQY